MDGSSYSDIIYVQQMLSLDEKGNYIIDSRKCQLFLNYVTFITKIICSKVSCCDLKMISEIMLLLCTYCVNVNSFEFNDNILPDKLPNGDMNEEVRDFFILLQNKLNNNIARLDFSGSSLFSVINLNAILNNLPQLISLNLSKTNIVQILSSVEGHIMASNKVPVDIPINIQELIINDVKLQDYYMDCFFHSSYDYLINLDLSNNFISKGIEIVTFYKFPSLQILLLANNNINSDSGSSIGEWLKSCKSLRVIDFSGNKLGDQGVTDVTANVKNLQNLEEIYFSRNGINDEGFINLMSNCGGSKSLIHINVSDNNITMNIDLKKKKAIFKKPPIRILSIYGNPIKDINDAYEKHFKNLPKLEELRIK